MSGARVVPISLAYSYEKIDSLLSKVNGVLFTGGSAPILVNETLTSEYGEKGCYIYEQVKKFNDQNNFFPLWGTCLGFELIHICANKESATLSQFNGTPSYTRENMFRRKARKSAIFTYRDPEYGREMMDILSELNVSSLSHNFGVSPETYKLYQNLTDNFNILSTMLDHDGNEFVAMIEHKKYPIFAVQFHPEKNIYEFFYPEYPHSEDAIISATYLSNFFVSLGRKNNNTFPIDELSENLIYNWPPIHTNLTYETINIIT